MENSKQSRIIYRVKGLRADAIIPIKVIPAIYHLGTASRSRAGLKTFHVIGLRDVWVNLERLMLASLPLNGKHLQSESGSVDAQHPCFDIFFHHAINRNQEQSKQKLLLLPRLSPSIFRGGGGETCTRAARQRQENSKFCSTTRDTLLLRLIILFALNSHRRLHKNLSKHFI